MVGIKHVWPVKAQLAEGPCWIDDALWCVDLTGCAIHRIDPHAQTQQSWPAPTMVSFVLPTQDGRLLVGMPGGIYDFNSATGEFSLLTAVESHLLDRRPNDACIGPDGALWFSSIDMHQKSNDGALYRWDGSGPSVLMDHGYVIANGPAFSPDGRTFYHTDSPARIVYAFDVGEQYKLSNKQRLIQIEEGAGWPDGTTVDESGCLWIGLWAGGGVRCYSAQGDLLHTISLPVTHVTKVAFGGSARNTLFVTTARQDLTPQQLLKQPLSGDVFEILCDNTGLATFKFGPNK